MWLEIAFAAAAAAVVVVFFLFSPALAERVFVRCSCTKFDVL